MQVFANGLFVGSLYILVALGFSATFQITRAFDLSFAATMTVAAYAAGLTIQRLGANYATAIFLAALAAGIVGGSFEVVIFGPLRRAGARPLVILLASFGLMIAVLNLISALFGDQPQFVQQEVVEGRIALFGAQLSAVQLATIAAAASVAALCWIVFYRTRWGLTARALANDQLLASCFGVSAITLTIQAALLGSAIGGIAAALTSIDTGYTPALGFGLLLPGVVACVVGGSGSLTGAVVGGLAIGLVHELAGWFLSIEWQDPLLFGILALFLLVRPQGLFGYPLDRR